MAQIAKWRESGGTMPMAIKSPVAVTVLVIVIVSMIMKINSNIESDSNTLISALTLSLKKIYCDISKVV